MMKTEAGTRARFAEIFALEKDKLFVLTAAYTTLDERLNEVRSSFVTSTEEYGKHPLHERIRARVGSFFGKATIYFPILEATRDLEQTTKDATRVADQICSTMQGLVYCGGNLPGRHELLTVGFDAARRQFNLRFSVAAVVGTKPVAFDVEGTFDEARYRTIKGGRASVRIPVKDSLSPVLYVPEGCNIPLMVTSYDGPGSYDRVFKTAAWKPTPSLSLIPVNTQDFIL